MRILHVCWGTGANNGAANIARLIMGEQQAAGDEPTLVSRPTWAQLKAADQLWCHCGWYWVFWLLAAYKKLVRRSPPSSSAYLHWMPECCYDPVRRRFHGWKKRLVGPIERWALRQADVLVATCTAEAGWIREYLGACRGEHGEGPKIVVSDIKRFFNLKKKENRPASGLDAHRPLHLLYLGRPHPLKGVKYLEQAISELNEHAAPSGADFLLRIVSDHVGEALERDWEWCDALCLPTLSENFGLVVAEALEHGKRVVTTDGAPVWEDCEGVVYLRGFRDGSDETRVRLLKDALSCLLLNMVAL